MWIGIRAKTITNSSSATLPLQHLPKSLRFPSDKRGDLDATVVENRQRIQSVAWMKNDETKLKRWGTCPISFNQQVSRWE
jgi:hypothetical protein